MTIRDVSTITGLSQVTISKYENGKSDITSKNVEKMFYAIGYDISNMTEAITIITLVKELIKCYNDDSKEEPKRVTKEKSWKIVKKDNNIQDSLPGPKEKQITDNEQSSTKEPKFYGL